MLDKSGLGRAGICHLCKKWEREPKMSLTWRSDFISVMWVACAETWMPSNIGSAEEVIPGERVRKFVAGCLDVVAIGWDVVGVCWRIWSSAILLRWWASISNFDGEANPYEIELPSRRLRFLSIVRTIFLLAWFRHDNFAEAPMEQTKFMRPQRTVDERDPFLKCLKLFVDKF